MKGRGEDGHDNLGRNVLDLGIPLLQYGGGEQEDHWTLEEPAVKAAVLDCYCMA